MVGEQYDQQSQNQSHEGQTPEDHPGEHQLRNTHPAHTQFNNADAHVDSAGVPQANSSEEIEAQPEASQIDSAQNAAVASSSSQAHSNQTLSASDDSEQPASDCSYDQPSHNVELQSGFRVEPQVGARLTPEYGQLANTYPADYDPYIFGREPSNDHARGHEAVAQEQSSQSHQSNQAWPYQTANSNMSNGYGSNESRNNDYGSNGYYVDGNGNNAANNAGVNGNQGNTDPYANPFANPYSNPYGNAYGNPSYASTNDSQYSGPADGQYAPSQYGQHPNQYGQDPNQYGQNSNQNGNNQHQYGPHSYNQHPYQQQPYNQQNPYNNPYAQQPWNIDLNDPNQNPFYGRWDPYAVISIILVFTPLIFAGVFVGCLAIWRTTKLHMKGRGLAITAVVLGVVSIAVEVWLQMHGMTSQEFFQMMLNNLNQTGSDGNSISALGNSLSFFGAI